MSAPNGPIDEQYQTVTNAGILHSSLILNFINIDGLLLLLNFIHS